MLLHVEDAAEFCLRIVQRGSAAQYCKYSKGKSSSLLKGMKEDFSL
jgi:hypothetical protein